VWIVPLEDEAVVFNPTSWETHVLNPAASLVLARAQSGECAVADIEQLLCDVLDQGERLRAGEHAERVLRELVSLRLIVERHTG